MSASSATQPRTAPFSVLCISLILLLRVSFGLAYVHTVPPWEASDEPFHLAYALHLAERGTLPGPDDTPESIQPPAYYALVAGWLRLSGTSTMALWPPPRNPYFYENNGSVNFALHLRTQPDDARNLSALYMARLFSLLVSLVGVPFVYLYGLRFGLGAGGSLIASALYAFWPQNVLNTSTVTNDGLSAVVGTILLWLLASRRPHFLLALLVCLGGAVVKLNILPLLLPVALAALGTTRRPRRLAVWGGIGLAGVAMLLIALEATPAVLLPFFKQNAQGMPALVALWQHIFVYGHGILIPEGLRYLAESLPVTAGWGNIPPPVWLNAVTLVGSALAALGLLLRPSRRMILPLSALFALSVAGLALCVFYLNVQLLPGRYMLPGLAAFCILLVVGWRGLGRNVGAALGLGSVTVLAMTGLWLPGGYVAGFYARPPAWDGGIPNARTYRIAPGIELVGWQAEVSAQPGETIPVTLFWRATQPIELNYRVQVEIIGPDGRGYGWQFGIPGRGNHPTPNWRAGEVFADEYSVQVRSDFPAPGIATLRVTLRDEQDRAFSSDLTEAEIRID